MSNVIYQTVEQKGTFTITGSIPAVKQSIENIPFEYGDVDSEGFDVTQLSEGEQSDLKKFEEYLSPEFDWSKVLEQIPRKKNGTFAKGRITVLAEGHDFAWEDEESYGMRGPRLYLKTESDTEAYLTFDWTIISKW